MRVVYRVNAAQYGERSIICGDENTALAFAMSAHGISSEDAKQYVYKMPYISEATHDVEIAELNKEVDDD